VRFRPAQALPVEALLTQPLHVLVRDYPELFGVLQAGGMSLGRDGAISLGEAGGVDRGVLEEIRLALRWRAPGAPGRP
jgi:hypothetical protein